MNKKKTRIGILINSEMQPAWVHFMLSKIQESNHFEIVLKVKRKGKAGRPKRGFFYQLLHDRGYQLFRIYKKLNERKYRAKPDAFKLSHLDEIITCDELLVEPIETKYSDRIKEEDIISIKEYNIDIFIRLGFKILRGGILESARFGIWSYHHGDNKVNRGGPAGIWEVLEAWNETGAVLQVLNEDLDGGTILGRTTVQTVDKSISLNKNSLYWSASLLLPRKLDEFNKLGPELFFKEAHKKFDQPNFYYNRLYRRPKNREMWPVLFYKFYGKIKRKLRSKFYFNQWILLFGISKSDDPSASFFRFKRIIPPKDRIWADPFLIQRDDKYYIFIEELILGKVKKGHISVIEMDLKGEYSTPQKVIEKDYHLSYPFLIEENGELFMIPESAENNTIDLYRCTNFPYEWEKQMTLIEDICAVDATIYKHEGMYWLFTNVKVVPGASTLNELHLYRSKSLTGGEWEPHPLNPIVNSVNKARPAGSIFEYKGKIYRPAQDNSGHYGRGMQIMEIVELTPESYSEAYVQSIYPNWSKDLISTHTFNRCGDLTVIDALLKRRR